MYWCVCKNVATNLFLPRLCSFFFLLLFFFFYVVVWSVCAFVYIVWMWRVQSCYMSPCIPSAWGGLAILSCFCIFVFFLSFRLWLFCFVFQDGDQCFKKKQKQQMAYLNVWRCDPGCVYMWVCSWFVSWVVWMCECADGFIQSVLVKFSNFQCYFSGTYSMGFNLILTWSGFGFNLFLTWTIIWFLYGLILIWLETGWFWFGRVSL